MKNYLLLLCAFLLLSCQNDDDVIGSEPSQNELNSFSFLSEFNSSLSEDLTLAFDGVDTYSGSIHYICDIENLVATYEFIGGDVRIDDAIQINSLTVNDFSQIVEYSFYNTTNDVFESYFVKIS